VAPTRNDATLASVSACVVVACSYPWRRHRACRPCPSGNLCFCVACRFALQNCRPSFRFSFLPHDAHRFWGRALIGQLRGQSSSTSRLRLPWARAIDNPHPSRPSSCIRAPTACAALTTHAALLRLLISPHTVGHPLHFFHPATCGQEPSAPYSCKSPNAETRNWLHFAPLRSRL
jgi:hypothetical protein